MKNKKIISENEWEICAPEDMDIDAKLLWEASKQIEHNYSNLYNFLVVRDGVIVFEQYYRNATPDQKHNIMSVDKSILSALIGIALQDEVLTSLDEQLVSFFPEYYNIECDPKILKVTIHNMLTMTSGFYYQRLAEDSQPIVKRMQQYNDWVSYIMHLPFFSNNSFIYNNFDPWLMGAILNKVTGKDLYTFANEKLFLPIGMQINEWSSMDTMNRIYGILKMSARDMARFGLLYLNRGSWGSKQIIPEKWVDQSTVDQTGRGYGYYWWIQRSAFYASGAGGTLLMVLPEYQLLVVMQSKHLKRFKFPMSLINEYVLPSIKK